MFRGQRVLTEEEWVASMEAIIERDYFPELPKLKVQFRSDCRPALPCSAVVHRRVRAASDVIPGSSRRRINWSGSRPWVPATRRPS